jgi:hypothetical protein
VLMAAPAALAASWHGPIGGTGACATNIAANNGTNPWITGCSNADGNGNHGIYRWDGSTWQQMNGYGVEVTVTDSENDYTELVNVVNAQNGFYTGEWNGPGDNYIAWSTTAYPAPESCGASWVTAVPSGIFDSVFITLGCANGPNQDQAIYGWYEGRWQKKSSMEQRLGFR